MLTATDSAGDGSEVLVEPGEHLLHDLGPIDHHVVGRVVNDVPFVLLRRAQPAEERLLRTLQRKCVVVSAVQHEDRDLNAGQEVEGIGLRRGPSLVQSALEQHRDSETILLGDHYRRRAGSPARTQIAYFRNVDVLAAYQVLDRLPRVLESLD